jgi:predicted HTH transcriptional regulator
MTPAEFTQLVRSLLALGRETEWVEFKQDNVDPQEMGENVAAVSNGAALHRKAMGYVLWGIEDKTLKIVGTTFKPHRTKKGNEQLENWLLRLLEPRIDVRIHEEQVDGHRLVLFETPPATLQPTRFSGREYVRVGSYTKPLADFPEKERALWRLFSATTFEQGVAAEAATSDDILAWIDHAKYFRLMGQPVPDNRQAILEKLCAEEIISPANGDRYDVTNVGAILFAQRLSYFRRLARKALRVIIYRGDNRYQTIKEQLVDRGYAIGFEGAIRYINDQLPQSEQIEQALRHKVRTYPEIAIRELAANALIHQDFLISGAGPTVEMFDSRIEFSNPGAPLIEPLRFIDQPPRSRNERLAGLMRRMNICEERGTGVDKVIISIELHQLPAPDFRTPGDNTVAVLFAPREFGQMDRDERIRACYQHACLLYVSGRRMTNATLRERLGIEKRNYPQASKIIREGTASGLIKQFNSGSESSRDRSYLPFWA